MDSIVHGVTKSWTWLSDFQSIQWLLYKVLGYAVEQSELEETWMSIDRWMDKEDVLHVYNIISAIKGNICSDMDKHRVCHTGWSKSEKKKNRIMY